MNYGKIEKLRIAVVLFLLANFVAPLLAQSTANFTSVLCNIINGVRGIVGIIALVMFLIGGVLYAIAHFMPAAGQFKGAIQGWAMGMIVGGVIGIILILLAPIIITTAISFSTYISTLPNC